MKDIYYRIKGKVDHHVLQSGTVPAPGVVVGKKVQKKASHLQTRSANSHTMPLGGGPKKSGR